jgi:nucleotide-binding universal stress UspA family protein
MYGTILVPLDGSRRAERILAHVGELARHCDSTIVLLRVVEPDLNALRSTGAPADYYTGMIERLEEEARTYLAGVQGELRAAKIPARAVVERGPVVSTIIEVAAREAADLVAMASHGRSGLSRFYYGSVAEGVLHRVDRPILLVRADEA